MLYGNAMRNQHLSADEGRYHKVFLVDTSTPMLWASRLLVYGYDSDRNIRHAHLITDEMPPVLRSVSAIVPRRQERKSRMCSQWQRTPSGLMERRTMSVSIARSNRERPGNARTNVAKGSCVVGPHASTADLPA